MKKLALAAMLGLAAASGQAEAFGLPFLNGGNAKAQPQQQQPLILAQAGNEAVRIQQLQEEIRQLNGRIEEMSFQLLQMQEQIRKAQEDNEFRFQELEKSEGGGSGNRPAVAAAPAEGSKKNDELGQIIEQNPADMSGQASNGQNPGGNPGGRSGTAAPPSTVLGSIEMDQSGMPKGATMNQGANNGSGSLPGVNNGSSSNRGGQQSASLSNEGDAYRAAYGHVLSGDYKIAEQEFTDYIAAHPKADRAADAHFWLGEAQYSQGKYNEAAKTFLDAHKAFGTSPKAPEMLLKLGMSLAALDNKDTACATLKEVTRRYPNAARPVASKVVSEQKRLGC
ncbi:tol-pal system protein YbgF [Rhizobiales bacterium RZME27]|jgi:tol-pal system protein YbgF|uniref:Cell division coordinator CpoB n=1 Tax=Endobacterium cereale TaxID=2663029 RepID=A0A6A8AFD2_9HYPH|nr:tol-pal system protein YbgF [Endobacterium cereale]MEB2845794.1 tol-pal system protein YbgF [Endobacterium cereale]MQY50035.1 tol-pal system protein YbgF [Endobacterium cereale]